MSLQHKELYEFGDFRLDVGERILLRGERRIALTSKAFDTLCFLVRRSGELIGKDDLMSEVWAGSVVEENNLDQQISTLRQALGERRSKGKEKYIETVRGYGYRFLADVRACNCQAVEPETSGSNGTDLPAGFVIKDRFADEQPVSVAEPVEVRPSAAQNDHRWRKWLFAVAFGAVAVLVIAAVALYRYLPSRETVVSDSIDSIAVLPLENVANDANIDYLSEGLTESLINDLSRLPNLRVMSGSSILRYKDKPQDAATVGREMNVRAVLTGSIKQVGDQLMINVRLEDTMDGRRLWGDQYVRKLAEMATIQRDIAQQVSNNLHLRLVGTGTPLVFKKDTESTDAYQFYLQGIYHLNKRTADDIRKGEAFFQKAIDKDPNYARAYTGLADAYLLLPIYSRDLTREQVKELDNKRYAATHAAQTLDDSLAEVHTLLAIEHEDAYEFAAAEAEYRRAIDRNPNLSFAHHSYSILLSQLGRSAEAIAEIEKARVLDPYSPSVAFNVGSRLAEARRFDEAIAQYRRVLETEPRHPMTHLSLALAYDRSARYEEAIAEYQQADVLLEKETEQSAAQKADILRRALEKGGARGYWQERLKFTLKDHEKAIDSAYAVASLYARLNERERAFEYLDLSYADREFDLPWIKTDPAFDGMITDPRFVDLLKRMGLPNE